MIKFYKKVINPLCPQLLACLWKNDYSDFLKNKTYNKCTGYWYNNGVQTKRKNVTIHKNCTHYTTMYYDHNNGLILKFVPQKSDSIEFMPI